MARGMDALVHAVRPPAGEPAGAIVLFHGRGTSEYDLLPLIDELDPERRLLGITPRGPLTLPPGGAHWYIIRELGYPDKETFDASFALASEFLDALEMPIERTVIGGFSQGGVMAYALALAEGRPLPAGLIALSSFVPTVEGLTLNLHNIEGFPVAIGHGTQDPIIGVEWGRKARETLGRAGADVIYRESPMGHAVDPAFLEELRPWLARLTQIAR